MSSIQFKCGAIALLMLLLWLGVLSRSQPSENGPRENVPGARESQTQSLVESFQYEFDIKNKLFCGVDFRNDSARVSLQEKIPGGFEYRVGHLFDAEIKGDFYEQHNLFIEWDNEGVIYDETGRIRYCTFRDAVIDPITFQQRSRIKELTTGLTGVDSYEKWSDGLNKEGIEFTAEHRETMNLDVLFIKDSGFEMFVSFKNSRINSIRLGWILLE